MVCPKCGGNNADGAAFCAYCGNGLNTAPQNPAPAQPYAYQNPGYQPNPTSYAYSPSPEIRTVKENIPMGIIGALGGSLLGIASIVLFFQMDMVASISGLILAFCTLKGYELLGKKLSILGIILCIAIMLAAPYIALVIHIAILYTKHLDLAFIDAFKLSVEVFSSGAIPFSDIMKDLAMVYVFAAMGGIGTIITAFKSNKK